MSSISMVTYIRGPCEVPVAGASEDHLQVSSRHTGPRVRAVWLGKNCRGRRNWGLARAPCVVRDAPSALLTMRLFGAIDDTPLAEALLGQAGKRGLTASHRSCSEASTFGCGIRPPQF